MPDERTTEEGEKPKRGRDVAAAVAAFAWSNRQGRYQYRNGKPVKDETMGRWIEAALESSKARVRSLTDRLVSGDVNTAEWAIAMRDELRAGHRMMAQLAHGPELSRSQLGRLGAIMRAQYGYLNAFSSGLESGDIATNAAIITRAEMYIDAMWNTWQNESANAKARRGFTKIRNILDPFAKHCAGCISETARGWIAIGTEIPIGARDCRVRDRCRFEYR